MSKLLIAALLLTSALSQAPAPTPGNYSPAAGNIVADTRSSAPPPSTTAAAPTSHPPPAPTGPTTTSDPPVPNTVSPSPAPAASDLTSFSCTVWSTNDCTTTTQDPTWQNANDMAYYTDYPLTAFNSIRCSRMVTTGEQLDVSGVDPAADSQTGMRNGAYLDGATKGDWQCESFVKSVKVEGFGNLTSCQGLSGTCLRLMKYG